MSVLFDIPEPPVNHAAGDDLREQIHRHLMQHPGLTAYEIALALRLESPRDAGQRSVRRQLLLMEDDGEAEKVGGTRRVRWVAT